MLFRRKAPSVPAPPPPLRWEAVAAPPGFFSTGIADLDAALGGGCRAGTTVAVEADTTVANEDALIVAVPPIANFLTTGRGAIIVPPVGVLATQLRDSVLRCLASDLFDSRVRVVDYTTIDESRPWVLPMARFDRYHAVKAMVLAENAVRGPNGGPFLEFTGFDMLENTLNPERALRMLTDGVGRVKQTGNLNIVWVRHGSPAAAAVAAMVDVVLELSRAGGRLQIRGIRPNFAPRGIGWNESGGRLRAELGLAEVGGT